MANSACDIQMACGSIAIVGDGAVRQSELLTQEDRDDLPVGDTALVAKLPPLSIQCPELVNEWHESKNEGLDPKTISAGSSQDAWWDGRYVVKPATTSSRCNVHGLFRHVDIGWGDDTNRALSTQRYH